MNIFHKLLKYISRWPVLLYESLKEMLNFKKYTEMFGNTKVKEVWLNIDYQKCNGCSRCVEKCRQNALRIHYNHDKGTVWMAYPEKCSCCGRCAKACDRDVLELKIVTGEVSHIY